MLEAACNVQADLQADIGRLLHSFAQRKTAEVSAALTGLRQQLGSGAAAVSASHAALADHTLAAQHRSRVRSQQTTL